MSIDSDNVFSEVRFDWYQTDSTVVVNFYLKGAPKDKVNLEFQQNYVSWWKLLLVTHFLFLTIVAYEITNNSS